MPVIVATLAFAWRYRSSNSHAVRSSELAYEGRIEFVTWSIPALTVLLLGGVIWISSQELDPRAPIPAKVEPLRVDVVALDWKWLFIYPDQGIAAVNQLTVPVDTPITFRLTSATVMNSDGWATWPSARTHRTSASSPVIRPDFRCTTG